MRIIKYVGFIALLLVGTGYAVAAAVSKGNLPIQEDKTAVHVTSQQAEYSTQILPGVWALLNPFTRDVSTRGKLSTVPLFQSPVSHPIVTARSDTSLHTSWRYQEHRITDIQVDHLQLPRSPDEKSTPFHSLQIVLLL